jgi:hypothetical protein
LGSAEHGHGGKSKPPQRIAADPKLIKGYNALKRAHAGSSLDDYDATKRDSSTTISACRQTVAPVVLWRNCDTFPLHRTRRRGPQTDRELEIVRLVAEGWTNA